MLNDTALKSKANIWQSNDEWKLETINQSIYIENMSNHTVVGIENECCSDCRKLRSTQIWTGLD